MFPIHLRPNSYLQPSVERHALNGITFGLSFNSLQQRYPMRYPFSCRPVSPSSWSIVPNYNLVLVRFLAQNLGLFPDLDPVNAPTTRPNLALHQLENALASVTAAGFWTSKLALLHLFRQYTIP